MLFSKVMVICESVIIGVNILNYTLFCIIIALIFGEKLNLNNKIIIFTIYIIFTCILVWLMHKRKRVFYIANINYYNFIDIMNQYLEKDTTQLLSCEGSMEYELSSNKKIKCSNTMTSGVKCDLSDLSGCDSYYRFRNILKDIQITITEKYVSLISIVILIIGFFVLTQGIHMLSMVTKNY